MFLYCHGKVQNVYKSFITTKDKLQNCPNEPNIDSILYLYIDSTVDFMLTVLWCSWPHVILIWICLSFRRQRRLQDDVIISCSADSWPLTRLSTGDARLIYHAMDFPFFPSAWLDYNYEHGGCRMEKWKGIEIPAMLLEEQRRFGVKAKFCKM